MATVLSRSITCARCQAPNPPLRVTCYRCGHLLDSSARTVGARSLGAFEPDLPDVRHEARRAARKPVCITGATVQGVGVVRHNATIVDLTQSGMQLQTPLGIAAGSTLRMAFRYRGATFDTTGVVRYVHELPRGIPPGPRTFACGVELKEALRDLPGDTRRPA